MFFIYVKRYSASGSGLFYKISKLPLIEKVVDHLVKFLPHGKRLAALAPGTAVVLVGETCDGI